MISVAALKTAGASCAPSGRVWFFDGTHGLGVDCILTPLRGWASQDLIGEDEDGAGEIGFEGGLVIVAGEDAILPNEQVGILVGELVPVGDGAAGHALADQEKVRMGDGLVIELRLAAGGGKALQRGGEVF